MSSCLDINKLERDENFNFAKLIICLNFQNLTVINFIAWSHILPIKANFLRSEPINKLIMTSKKPERSGYRTDRQSTYNRVIIGKYIKNFNMSLSLFYKDLCSITEIAGENNINKKLGLTINDSVPTF